MLILPLDRQPTRENFPYITAALVLINILVLFVLQGGDQAVEQAAADRYIDSGMLVQEWSWYREWSEFTHGLDTPPEEVDQWLPAPGEDRRADHMRLVIIDSEPAFHRALEDGRVVDADSDALARWRQARSQLEADRDQSFTLRFLLRYDEISPGGLFVHMFMHAGVGHLVGNLMFLILLGILVEPVLGGLRYLSLYLVSGLGAAATSLAVNWGTGVGLLGASGAIAGLMGALAVIYGRRQVRFFYWAFVYFDYVRAPALVLLPLWLGWELIAWTIHEGSNIAYEAHAGGIVSGAVLGLLAVWTGQVRTEQLDRDQAADTRRDRRTVDMAEKALDDLEPARAKRLLRPLLTRHADEPRLWSLYLAACRLRDDAPDLEYAVGRILRLPGATSQQRELIIDALNQHRQAREVPPAIPASLAVALTTRLAQWGDIDGACYLADILSRSRRPVAGYAEAIGVLAERLESSGDQRAGHYRRLHRHRSET